MNFFLSQNGQKVGPYSLEQLQIFLKQGLLATTDQVWANGWPSWMTIGNVPGLGFQPAIQQSSSSTQDAKVSSVTTPETAVVVAGENKEPTPTPANEAVEATEGKVLANPGPESESTLANQESVEVDSDPEAYVRMGNKYFNGEGVQQDYHQAYLCYLKAADQGNASAQTKIGLMYRNGWGLPTDYSQAFQWYYKAANQDYRAAQYNIVRTPV